MAATYNLRAAAPNDIPEMLSVLHSAFDGSPLDSRVFPPDDPETDVRHIRSITRGLDDPRSHMVVVIETASDNPNLEDGVALEPPKGETKGGRIVAWARWVRRLQLNELPERHIVTPEDFPPLAEKDLGVRFFQANVDVSRSVVGRSPHWFLSMMVVSSNCQRKGVGSMLMRYGVEKADAEEEEEQRSPAKGWMCYVNGSKVGAGLYRKFGFETVQVSDFGDGVATWHMKREARERAKAP